VLRKWQNQNGIISPATRAITLIIFWNRNRFQTFLGANPEIQQLLRNDLIWRNTCGMGQFHAYFQGNCITIIFHTIRNFITKQNKTDSH